LELVPTHRPQELDNRIEMTGKYPSGLNLMRLRWRWRIRGQDHHRLEPGVLSPRSTPTLHLASFQIKVIKA
ncbi:MAG: hypothetical protein LBI99_10725, partial [Propionibacteriaceae bacterium]|nr:hypothetical protein [Propionibacteriaceae bacterium]